MGKHAKHFIGGIIGASPLVTAVFGATGGVEDTTSVSGYKLHTFYNDGTATGGTGNTDYHTNHTFTVTGAAGEVELLLISGGGAGGQYYGGGGGGGAVMISNAFTLDPGDYTVTVGAGGLGLLRTQQSTSPNNGRPSTFTDGGYASTTGTGQDHASSTFSITAVGGQAGEAGVNFTSQTRPAGANGGGQGAYNNQQSWSPTTATVSWPTGYSGTIHSGYTGGAHGIGNANVYYVCAGGAGAGANGASASSNGPGNGGSGVSVTGFSASTLSVAGGGGGAHWGPGTSYATGSHGGGSGGEPNSQNGGDASSYGAGGGGGQADGGDGSHGLVVIRYQV